MADEKVNKVWVGTHSGHYLGGITLISAPTERMARNDLEKELKKIYGENHNKFIWTITEFDYTKRHAENLADGDY